MPTSTFSKNHNLWKNMDIFQYEPEAKHRQHQADQSKSKFKAMLIILYDILLWKC